MAVGVLGQDNDTGQASRTTGNRLTGPDSLGSIAVLPAVNSPKAGNVPLDAGQVDVTAGALYEAFVGAAQVRDGRLLVVDRQGTEHVGDVGTIVGRLSSDLGLTFDDPFTVASDPNGLDCRDPNLTLLSDGRLACSYFVEDPVSQLGVGVRVAYSAVDDPETWGDPISIPTPWATNQATSGPILERTDGALLLPVYGYTAPASKSSVAIVISTDGGATWSTLATVATTDGVHDWTETVIVFWGATIVGLIREQSTFAFWRTTSTDGGETWTAPTSVLATASGRPAMLVYVSGGIVTFYRDSATSNALYTTSWDGAATWAAPASLTALVGEMDYAQAVQLAGGVGIVAFSVKESAAVANVHVRYIVDGSGTVLPNGNIAGSGAPPSGIANYGQVVRTNGANYTKNANVWSDIDTANLAVALATGAHRCRLRLSGRLTCSVASKLLLFNWSVDGVAVLPETAGSGPLVNMVQQGGVAAISAPFELEYTTAVLAAGPHTFRPRWAEDGPGGEVWTLEVTAQDYLTFSVEELPY